MNRNTLRYGLLLVLALMSLSAAAQVVYWKMPPRKCELMERVTASLYKINDNGKIGLIDVNGNEVCAIENDNIEPFYDGFALLSVNEGSSQRLTGVVEADGTFHKIEQKYYLIDGMKFFSEGLLPVSNGKGKFAYIDENGDEIIGFSNGFTVVKPFCEGYASVYKGEKNYQLISKTGDRCRIETGGLARVTGGTNLCKGRSLVWDEDGKFYEFSSASGTCTKSKKPANTSLDFLFRLSSVSGQTKQVAYQTVSGKEDGIKPEESNGLYKYSNNGVMILPAQFTTATPFVDGVAVVSIGGKYGLLGCELSGGKPSVSSDDDVIEYKPGGNAKCTFTLKRPAVWDSDINVEARNSAGDVQTIVNTGDGYTFDYKPTGESDDFHITVLSHGVMLWGDQLSYRFKKVNPIQPVQISVSVVNTKANAQDECVVQAVVRNPNPSSVTVRLDMSGSDKFMRKNETHTIPAGGSVTVSSCFKFTDKMVKGQFVTVSSSDGGKATKADLTLTGFYSGG